MTVARNIIITYPALNKTVKLNLRYNGVSLE